MSSTAAGQRVTEKVALFMGGSFYPLHEGHIQLLKTAKFYHENTRGVEVTHCILCPSHWSSVMQKFTTREKDSSMASKEEKKGARAMGRSLPDPRTHLARGILPSSAFPSHLGSWDYVAREDDAVDSFEGGVGRGQQTEAVEWTKDDPYLRNFVWCERMATYEVNPGYGVVSRAIREEMRERGIRMVQVVGTDSQVRNCLRGKAFGDVAVVIDSRGIPAENRELFNGVMTIPASNPNHPWGPILPPMSSTIQRFLFPAHFIIQSISPELKLEWLTDTGITLGVGRQGFVRLMRLGLTYVAMKVYERGGKHDTFLNEQALWRSMAQWAHDEERKHLMQQPQNRGSNNPSPSWFPWTRFDIIPRLYGVGVSADGKFGYIVTEVCVPLEGFVPQLFHNYKWQPTKSSVAQEFLNQFQLHPVEEEVFASYQTRLRNQVVQAISETWDDDNEGRDSSSRHTKDGIGSWALKAHTVRGLWSLCAKLRDAGVYHRDLKVPNVLLMPRRIPASSSSSSSSSNQSLYCQVLCCDFGVAKFIQDVHLWIARGMTRQYPIIALDTRRYDVGCESYFVACTIFETIEERQQLGEAGSDGTLAVQMKREGFVPTLSTTTKKLFDTQYQQHPSALLNFDLNSSRDPIRYLAYQWKAYCEPTLQYYNPCRGGGGKDQGAQSGEGGGRGGHYSPESLNPMGVVHTIPQWGKEHTPNFSRLDHFSCASALTVLAGIGPAAGAGLPFSSMDTTGLSGGSAGVMTGDVGEELSKVRRKVAPFNDTGISPVYLDQEEHRFALGSLLKKGFLRGEDIPAWWVSWGMGLPVPKLEPPPSITKTPPPELHQENAGGAIARETPEGEQKQKSEPMLQTRFALIEGDGEEVVGEEEEECADEEDEIEAIVSKRINNGGVGAGKKKPNRRVTSASAALLEEEDGDPSSSSRNETGVMYLCRWKIRPSFSDERKKALQKPTWERKEDIIEWQALHLIDQYEAEQRIKASRPSKKQQLKEDKLAYEIRRRDAFGSINRVIQLHLLPSSEEVTPQAVAPTTSTTTTTGGGTDVTTAGKDEPIHVLTATVKYGNFSMSPEEYVEIQLALNYGFKKPGLDKSVKLKPIPDIVLCLDMGESLREELLSTVFQPPE